MSWKPLAERIEQLPLILCGPILRRCEPDSVTVWVALKEEREVTLKVYSWADETYRDKDDNHKHLKPRMEGKLSTVELGKYLHVIAVTAELKGSDEKLAPGEVFYYELLFPKCEPNPGEDSFCLNAPDIVNAKNTPYEKKITKLYYSQTNYHKLPSFSLPPKELNKLRIIHGSCRKPHNEGLDAMPAIDDMLIVDWPVADERPHMLCLTGDQIYADDVSPTLLHMLIDAASTLLGWKEELPKIEKELLDLEPGLPKLINDIGPGERKILKDLAGFTSSDLANHLMGLGEYYAMYLFTWSDVLWPSDLPSYANVFPALNGKLVEEVPNVIATSYKSIPVTDLIETEEYTTYKEDKIRLNQFRETLPNVRRALANVPTYMIFDDHEVTDDWCLAKEWCENVFNKSLGRRVVKNALLSYAVFQAWGNTPTEFSSVKGQDLLDDAVNWSKSQGKDDLPTEIKLEERLGLPPRLSEKDKKCNKDKIFDFDWDTPGYVLKRNSGALDWNFSLNFTEFEVIFFDTRTRRSFSEGQKDHPSMLSLTALEKQLPVPQEAKKLVSIFVFPTPFIKIPQLYPEGMPPLIAKIFKYLLKKSIYEFDHHDQWVNQDDLFETVLAKLATRWRNTGNHQSRVVILTGDVHFAAASRLQYQSDELYKATLKDLGRSKKYKTVIVQFCSSSFKKQDDKTRFLHYHGYKFGSFAAILAEVFSSTIEWKEYDYRKLPVSSQWYGWSKPLMIGGAQSIEFGIQQPYWYGKNKKQSTRTPAVVDVSPPDLPPSCSSPIPPDLPTNCSSPRAFLPRQPEWRYRIDYILAENEAREPAPVTPSELFAPSPGDREKSIESYLKLAKSHTEYARKWGSGKEIVGVNNVGELTFEWGETNKSAIQTSWWRLKSKSDNAEFLKAFPLSKFKVSLEFEDTEFKMNEFPSERESE